MNMLKNPKGSLANINKQTLREPHAKYGAFICSVMVITQYNTEPPNY